MNDLDDDTIRGVIGEEIKAQLDAVLEFVKDLPTIKRELTSVREDLDAVKGDLNAIKVAVRDISDELQRHDEDILLLKRRAA